LLIKKVTALLTFSTNANLRDVTSGKNVTSLPVSGHFRKSGQQNRHLVSLLFGGFRFSFFFADLAVDIVGYFRIDDDLDSVGVRFR
jgi:hypothetical protein